MKLLNKMLYPVELVSLNHERFINKKKGEIMFPGRIFFLILSQKDIIVKLNLLKANEYSNVNCYIGKNAKYGYAIDSDKLVTLFYSKERYLNGIIESSILNGAKFFIYNIESSAINKDIERLYNILIKKGLKPEYE